MRDITALAGGAFLSMLVGGCALIGNESGTNAGAAHEATDESAGDAAWEGDFARDAVEVLAQLEGSGPADTTLRFGRGTLASDSLVAAVETAAREAGYAIRVVADPADDAVVRHTVVPVSDTPPEVRDHTLLLDAVQVRRRYARADAGGDGWRPAGPLLVRGADPRGVRLDGRARPAAPEPEAPVEPVRERLADAAGEPSARGTESPAGTAAESRGPSASTAPPLAIDPLSGKPSYAGLSGGRTDDAPFGFGSPLVPGNVADTGESNYRRLFEAYGNVDEVVLVFPNDSLTLGKYNKGVIRRTLQRFDPDTDVFSLVGCSLGPTRRENGNEALALGRANRVKEELLFAGVPAERILDEGCWAGESSARFPGRGVVMTLKRQSS